MKIPREIAAPDGGLGSFHERLANGIISLEGFLSEIRTASGREEMLALAASYLTNLLPIQVAGFYFPKAGGLEFALQTSLDAETAGRLDRLVNEAIDSGVFGWALNHSRPAAFKSPHGQTTLILAALRARHQVLGMFAAIPSSPSVAGWDSNLIVLSTYLASIGDALLSEELALKLQEHNRELDSLVQKRTRQLEEAKDAAEVANRAKSTFLATVSHELRTPLNAILGYSQILGADATLSGPQREQLFIVQQSARHLLFLINDLLDMSKAEASAIEIVWQRIPLWPLLEEAAGIIRPRAVQKALQFECQMAADAPETISADPMRLKQVLLNLLGNAIKFTDQGGIRLQVTRLAGCVRFAAVDTGCGIAPQDLPRLFQPFQQFGDRFRRTEGTGLGLSIARKLLQAMGSDLHVRSEPGKGSTFWFELPCESSAAASPGARCIAEAPASLAPARLTDHMPEAIRTRLCELADSGDIMGLQEELEHWKESAAVQPPWIGPLLELAVACKISAIRDILDRHETDHSGGG